MLIICELIFFSYAQASRFNEFAEMALMRVLDACTDESKLVSMKFLPLRCLENAQPVQKCHLCC